LEISSVFEVRTKLITHLAKTAKSQNARAPIKIRKCVNRFVPTILADANHERKRAHCCQQSSTELQESKNNVHQI
jgi:hypothetical protein